MGKNGNNKCMITLIIFLFLFLILFLFLTLRTPIIFKLKIINEDLYFTYKAFFKERHIENKISNFIKSGSARFDENILLDVSEVIDIDFLKTKVIVGSPIINITNIGVVSVSYILSKVYNLPFREKKGLYFKVVPDYKNWIFKLFVDGKIRVSIISIILIIIKMKRRIKNKCINS